MEKEHKGFIRLRPYKLMDADYFVKWADGEYEFQLWCAGAFQYPLTKGQLDDYFRKYEDKSHSWCMTAVNEAGVPVGHLLIRNVDYDTETAYFGRIILDPASRGKGYGTDMMRGALRYAFDVLKISTVKLAVFENNEAACKCYKAVGFQEVGYQKEPFRYKGETWEIVDMVVSREDNLPTE